MPDVPARHIGPCGRLVPSDTTGLAFFEDRSQPDPESCAVCSYHSIAHDRFSGRLMDVVQSGKWPSDIEPHDFVVRTEGEQYDRYYCGHAGWE